MIRKMINLTGRLYPGQVSMFVDDISYLDTVWSIERDCPTGTMIVTKCGRQVDVREGIETIKKLMRTNDGGTFEIN